MSKFSKTILTIALAAITPFMAHAGSDVDKSPTASAIRKNFAAAYPSAPSIKTISETPIKGLYEVHLGSEIIYSDPTGAHFVQGTLISTAQKKNLTEERLNTLNKVDFSELPLKDAVVTKIGTGADKIVVFADPNCGFCKKFERETVPQLKDVTIYTLLLPILSPDSKEKAKAVWCASDRSATWTNLIQKDVSAPVPDAKCDTSVIDRNLELAKKVGVSGTPTIFFENGARVPGALPLDAINSKIQEARASKAAAK